MKYHLIIAKLITAAAVFFAISTENFASVEDLEYRFVTETNVIETLEVRRSGIEIDVPDAGVTFEVGDRVPLFQMTSNGYIAGMERLDGTIELIAFPKRGPKNDPTGWVTNDKFLIFARNARSIQGKLELDRYEELDVLNSHSDHVEVILRRFGRETLLRIPSKSSGFKRSEREVTFRRKVEIPEEERVKTASKTPARKTGSGRKISVRYGAEEGMVIENAQGKRIQETTPTDDSVEEPANDASIVFVNSGWTPPEEATASPSSTPAPDDQQAATKSSESQSREQVVAELKEVVMLEIMAELRKSKELLAKESASAQEGGDTVVSAGVEDSSPSEDEISGRVLKKADILAIVESETVSEPQTNLELQEEIASDKAGSPSTDVVAKVEDKVEESVEIATQTLEVATASAIDSVVEEDPREAPAASRRADSRPEAVGPILGFFVSNTMMFQILLLVCILEGAILVRLQKKKTGPSKSEETSSGSEFFSIESSGESFISETYNETPKDRPGDLTGTLDGYGLGQVIQFFHSSGDSGILTVINVQGDKETMTFKDGHIIQATSGKLIKDEAVYQIMRRSEGSFDFTRKDTSEAEVQIVQDTMSLLMEGTRLADENGFDNGV